MLNEKQLRDYLVFAFGELRSLSAKLDSVMMEVASVRDALIEIGPQYNEILSHHRKNYENQIRPEVENRLQQFDVLIEQLKQS